MAFFLNAQIETHDIDIITELAEEEREILEALVLYPKEIRESVFEASTHPEIVIKLASVQTRTSTQFKELMMYYPEDVQKEIWEMTRFPGLIDQLVDQPENLEAIIKQYPESIHEYARSAVVDHLELLKEIDRLKAFSESTFQRILDPLPENTKKVFSELIDYPEILVLLNQNIELTILGGDFYKKAPDLVRYHADSLNLVVARQQALELEDWKYELENNPEAAKELKQVTAEFAEEYGYEASNLTQEKEVMDDIYYDDEEYDYDEEDIQRVEHHYYHYPYWFGYPYWYSYSYWRPYPFWYECGFFWDPYGTVVIFNMPSPFFMHWYFYRPYHHYQYVYLSNHFVKHYYGHRYSGSSISGTVRTWRTSNRNVVNEDWLADEKKRIPALKEFGKMENARIDYNDKNPKKIVSEREYVEKHQKKYPYLNSSIQKEKTQKDVTRGKIEYQNPLPPKTDVKVRKSEITPPQREPQKPVRKEKPTIRYKKAQDYHKQTWQQKTPRTPTRSKSTVVPRRTTPKSNTKPKSTPRRKN